MMSCPEIGYHTNPNLQKSAIYPSLITMNMKVEVDVMVC
jgi:hypothetical protein